MDSKKEDVRVAAQMGFDVLQILSERFRQEAGRQFDDLWKSCVSDLTGPGADLLSGLRPDKENSEINITIVRSRFQIMAGMKDESLVLDAFVDLIRNLTERTEKLLGEGLVGSAMEEVFKMLSLVGKYERDSPSVKYFLDKLRSLRGMED